ncbi:D-alanine--poly(phosphoribitol) ligase [Streptomyces dioscori]|uniref:D-alanine--poly(Phosphoribitol) ligase n=1 Tax=Streptomyces dioscori TaxID=2109333 RepID=A0A2P8PT48_9ACTN|nr:AMP-binding protein [Streptomyces dioscori]PSM37177.1 D-alanine--poly(phosphoribitol) ligase [Streptomyces dioscori]
MTEIPEHALHARFLRGLAASPGRPAFRADTGTMTYEALHEQALAWAGALLASPAGPPRAVGVLAEKGRTSYAGLLAALYAGAAAVPLAPDFPVVRTRRMLAAAGVSAVIADRAGLAALEAADPEAADVRTGVEAAHLDVPVLTGDGGAAGRFPVVPVRARDALGAPRPVAPGDLAHMLFTSGSTGRPKGVPITHASTHHYFSLLDARYDFGPEDVFSQTFGLNFDCAMFDLFCAWGAGASVHTVPVRAYTDLPAFLAERGTSVWFSTPSAIALVRRMGGLAPAAMPSLRWSLFAGEALRCADAADWQGAASRSTVENLYGPTELTVTVTGHRWSPRLSPALAVNGHVPIGRVHEGHDHLLLGPDGAPSEAAGAAGPAGVAGAEGELCVTGPQMTAGYLDPADDEGRFLRYEGRTWYRTGDRVRRLTDGELVYLGRLDAQVQVQGWRVELAEVDDAVRACDGVEDAVTVTRPAGGGGLELVVFYTGAPASPVVLAGQLRRVLPEGMLPRAFRHVESFPLNANRKIDRSLLAATAGTPRGPGGP